MMCALTAFTIAGFSEYAPIIKPNPAIDAAVLRLCARYGIPVPAALFAQPLNVADLRPFFAAADSLDNQNKLTPQESYLLRRIELFARSENALVSWSRPDKDLKTTVRLGLTGKIDPGYQDSATLGLKGIISPLLSGNAGPFSYYSGIDVWTDYRSDTMFQISPYQPFDGPPHNLYGRIDSGRVCASDVIRGGIRWQGKWIGAETGIDYLRIGPAENWPVTLSGTAPPMVYARATMNLGWMEYRHAFGQLKIQKDRAKWFYLHRLDVPLLHSQLTLGINEIIINGSTAELAQTDSLRRDYYGMTRGVEWAYLIPFVPFKFTEHYLGDRDNAGMSFDFNLCYPAGFRWYGELFLDDLTAPWTFWTSDWGNKWAFTVGGRWFGALLKKDVAASAEYSRIEPWVYTHFYGASHNFQHFNASLGSPLGPNADALTLTAESEVVPKITAGLSFVNIRKNSVARGGQINEVFQDSLYVYQGQEFRPENPDSWTKHFLGAGTQRSSIVSMYGRYGMFELFTVNGNIGYDLAPGKHALSASVWGGFLF
jgi:hypothetical protein